MSYTNSYSVLVEYYNMLGSEVGQQIGDSNADELFNLAYERANMLLGALGVFGEGDADVADLQTLIQLACVRSNLFAAVLDWIEANPEMIENLLLDRQDS